MADFIAKLADNAWKNVESGYYTKWLSIEPPIQRAPSLKEAIEQRRGKAIITEVKYISPSLGNLRSSSEDPVRIAREMLAGGAAGISVLAEPNVFGGSVENVYRISKELRVPTLFKDVVVSTEQVAVAKKVGASAVLLIMRLFNDGYCEKELENVIRYSHELGLEVVLETHGRREFEEALTTDCEVIGINNRDLNSLVTKIETTLEVLAGGRPLERLVMSESGISGPTEVRVLRDAGVDAFLVGSSVMLSRDITSKVKELVEACS